MPRRSPEIHYSWTWMLNSSPAALWPLVSNTDRFNRDCGFPPVEIISPGTASSTKSSADSRRVRVKVAGLVIEWDERAFEWNAPRRYGVERFYHSGPVAHLRMSCELVAQPSGGTALTYQMWMTPANLLGRLAIPWQIGRRSRATFERVFRHYDQLALRHVTVSSPAQPPTLSSVEQARLAAMEKSLVDRQQSPELVRKLTEFISTGDDLSLMRIRPYAVADSWGFPRQKVLHLFLHATRAGLLDFRWDVLCPHCRGARPGISALEDVRAEAHCDTCQIDFTTSLDQSVELTFSPNPAVRSVKRVDFCIGGPQVTPHIVAQQKLEPGEVRAIPLAVTPGRYRLRSPQLKTHLLLGLAEGASPTQRIALDALPAESVTLAPGGMVELVNPDAREARLVIIEQVAWTDQATTAAEVTSQQLFRDLFSREVLRPGERISVGTLTLVFTDLRGSTQLYQDIGDAPAFGRVLTHFTILKEAVASENGAIVKTMGDAIMAVFTHPVNALRAMRYAQRKLSQPGSTSRTPFERIPEALALKVGLHHGPCIAINQNDRLDYFGTTVNLAARLSALSTGSDIILSAPMHDDPEVSDYLASEKLSARMELVTVKSFERERTPIWRVG